MRALLFLLLLTSTISHAQDAPYQIKSYQGEGVKAPNTHYLGEAWLKFLVEANESFNYNITEATFAANSTLDWHKHSSAQVLIVVDGVGYYQERGKEAILMNKGDVIKCPKDTEHWHSSSKDQSVSYIAVYSSDPTIWTEKLTWEAYDKVAKKLGYVSTE